MKLCFSDPTSSQLPGEVGIEKYTLIKIVQYVDLRICRRMQSNLDKYMMKARHSHQLEIVDLIENL